MNPLPAEGNAGLVPLKGTPDRLSLPQNKILFLKERIDRI
jgi:hypothetical protein